MRARGLVALLALAGACRPAGDEPPAAAANDGTPAVFAVRGRWPGPLRLRYRLEANTAAEAGVDASAFARAVERAAGLWNATGIVTLQATTDADAELVLGFRRGHHGACAPFGADADVAHTGPLRSPTFVHFDAGRSWHEHDGPGVSLFATALHELGHVLGLGHADVEPAVMGTGLPRPTTLQRHDLAGLQSLYGGGSDGPGDLGIERADGTIAAVLRGVAPAATCGFTVFDADGDGGADVLTWRHDARGHGTMTVHSFTAGPLLARTIGPFPGAVAAGCDIGCVVTTDGRRLLVSTPPGKTPIARQFDRHGVPDLPSAAIDIDELRRATRTDRGDLDGDGTDERVRLRP
ncbi:MAG: matrixin family metalloprotease [Planctomycetes bacterium]|nr:matrixin family metalloprotease [Planctomycetota bacterium]